MSEKVMSELEHMIVEDMREWVTVKLLDGEDMFEYLDKIQSADGTEAYSKKMQEFANIYWRDHLWP
jgi:hypothetical protein